MIDLLKKIGVTNGVTALLKSVTLFYKSLFYLIIDFYCIVTIDFNYNYYIMLYIRNGGGYVRNTR